MMPRTSEIERWTLSIERSAFASSIFLHPGFPSGFEHEHVRKLRFLAQASGNFPAGITTQAAAINDDFFSRGPRRQKLWQQFIPSVFIQRQRAWNVIARELVVRSGIDPDGVVTPCARLIDSHQFRGRN